MRRDVLMVQRGGLNRFGIGALSSFGAGFVSCATLLPD